MNRRRLPKLAGFTLECLEKRTLLTGMVDYGQWPLRGDDPATSILVRFRDSSSGQAQQDAINQLRAYVKVTLTDGPSILNLGQGIAAEDALTELRANPIVAYAVANRSLGTASVSTPAVNDSSYSQQWGLNQSNNIDVDAPEGWNITTGSSSTIIAVIDTGLDVSHPEFAGRLWVNPTAGSDGYTGDINGYNFGDSNSSLTDIVGHGTHVTGIIAATGNNGQGHSSSALFD